MGHQITDTDNMFSVRELPWHGLGEVLDEYPTRAEAQPLVHGWEPQQVEMFYEWPVVTEDGDLIMEKRTVESSVLNLRDDNGAELGAVGKGFVPVTNGELWDVAEAIQDVPEGDVLYETGGSLDGGKRVWLTLRLAEPIVIPGDPNGDSVPFFLLQNGHAANGAFRGSATMVRPVCANTIQADDLDAKARGTEFAFRHTTNVGERVEEARQAVAGWRESVEAYRMLAQSMIDLRVSKKQEREFIERFIPAPLATMTSDRVKHNIDAARDQWMDCYQSVTCEGITGTAWGLLQASSEWSEHIRRANSKETRFKRAVLDRNQIITDAKHLALAVAGA